MLNIISQTLEIAAYHVAQRAEEVDKAFNECFIIIRIITSTQVDMDDILDHNLAIKDIPQNRSSI